MSTSRQPYVTLKQFIVQLVQSPSQVTPLQIHNYWRVTFSDNYQQHNDVSQTDDWNALNLGISESLYPLKDLINLLNELAETHPDAAVTLNGKLVSEFVWYPVTKNVLFKDTLLNKPRTLTRITIQEFVTGLNALKIDQSAWVLSVAMEKMPGKDMLIYRVGSKWMTKDDLFEAYPKLVTHTHSYQSLFTSVGSGSYCILECRIPEAKMRESFSDESDNLIDRLLKEATVASK